MINKAYRPVAVSKRIVLLSAIWLGASGCASPLQRPELSKEWDSFLPRNMFVRSPSLYKTIETRVRKDGAATKCEGGKCTNLLSTGRYVVDRFGFRTTTVIENEYPIYSATYFVKDGLRVGPPTDNKRKAATVVIAGDSNTWGEGHNYEDTFVGLLAKQFPNIDFVNLSRCPFQEECTVPAAFEFTQKSRPTLLILPIFESTSIENRKQMERFYEASKEFATVVEFNKIDFERLTNGRHVDYPTRLLSKLGHALVAAELTKIISSKMD